MVRIWNGGFNFLELLHNIFSCWEGVTYLYGQHIMDIAISGDRSFLETHSLSARGWRAIDGWWDILGQGVLWWRRFVLWWRLEGCLGGRLLVCMCRNETVT